MEADQYALLRNFVNNFISVSEEDWKLHRDALILRKIQKGQVLLKAGQVCDHVWFINKGAFRTYEHRNGEEITNYFFFENFYVTNYESFLTRQPSADYIVALEDSELLELSYEKTQMMFEKIPAWQ